MREYINIVEGVRWDDRDEIPGLGRMEWQVVEQYAYGDCDILALAFHERTGYPLQAIVDVDEQTGKESYCHVWVLHPSGQALDIFGLRPLHQLEENWIVDDWENAALKTVSKQWLLEHLPKHQKTNLAQDIVEANRIIDLFILQQYSELRT